MYPWYPWYLGPWYLGNVRWQLGNVLWQLGNVLWQLGNVLWQLGHVLWQLATGTWHRPNWEACLIDPAARLPDWASCPIGVHSARLARLDTLPDWS